MFIASAPVFFIALHFGSTLVWANVMYSRTRLIRSLWTRMKVMTLTFDYIKRLLLCLQNTMQREKRLHKCLKCRGGFLSTVFNCMMKNRFPFPSIRPDVSGWLLSEVHRRQIEEWWTGLEETTRRGWDSPSVIRKRGWSHIVLILMTILE